MSKVDLLRIGDVAELLTVSKSTISRWSKEGIIPPPLQLGPSAIAWRRQDIENWVESKAKKAGPLRMEES